MSTVDIVQNYGISVTFFVMTVSLIISMLQSSPIFFLKMLDETGEENTLKADVLKAYQNLWAVCSQKGKAVEQLTEEEKESRKPLLYNYSGSTLPPWKALNWKITIWNCFPN